VGADYGIDLDEVRQVIDTAEVLVIRCSVTDRRLLVDARTSEAEGPMVRVVPPVTSGEERFKTLKMLRPRFKTPQRILTFQWPRHAALLRDAGVWDHLERRLLALGWSDTKAQCDEAFRQLVDAERAVEAEAVRGGSERFKTLWSADGSDDE